MLHINIDNFSQNILGWFDKNGRKNLPWQKNPTPYSVWISEIMLQQTQVNTVIPYYMKFMATFPSLDILARASEDEVLALWSGLGYYSRARNLHKTARILIASNISAETQGNFPATLKELESLPGIGRSTAGAILALAMQQRAAILDGNVKRVLTRCFAIEGWPGKSDITQQLWKIAEQLTPQKQVANYTQAMMDLGATVCTRTKPDCSACPLADTCLAKNQGNQSDYPGKKEKTKLPEKHQKFYLLLDKDNQLMMEKRPPSGIWGGLWTPPACDKNDDGEAYLLANHGLKIGPTSKLPRFRHTFSHFHLYLYPVRVKITCKTNNHITLENNQQWDNINNWLNRGISAAVKKMLLQLNEEVKPLG